MANALQLLTTGTLCALAVFACYCHLMVAAYSDACTSVVCQVLWG